MITRKILNTSSWRLPYYIYLSIMIMTGSCLYITSMYLDVNFESWTIPDTLRLAVVIPAVVGAVGLFGLIPDQYLGKSKKANIFRFVKSPAFKDFLIFWIVISLVQAVCYFVLIAQGEFSVLWKIVDLSTTLAGISMLAVTSVLFVGLFTNRR